MHEYSITNSVLEILNKIVKEKKIKRVKKINLEFTPLSQIDPDSVKFYFNFLAKDNSILKDAKLKFKRCKIKIECRRCKNIFEINSFTIRCPRCSSKEVRLVNEDDIKITSIEV